MPAPADDEFYDLTAQLFLQQGDIFPDAPLISLPPSKELVILRTPGNRAPLPELRSGNLEAVREKAISAFPNEREEYVVVLARRGMAVLLTQTCDLLDTEHWLVCPAYTLEGSDVDPANLRDNKYASLFRLPAHPHGYFPESYIALSEIRPVRSVSLDLADRIASLTRSAQIALTDKIADALSRRWGFSEGEEVPQTAQYRCNRCNLFTGIDNPVREFKAGDRFPRCDNCAKIHKSAQWYPLVKHRKY